MVVAEVGVVSPVMSCSPTWFLKWLLEREKRVSCGRPTAKTSVPASRNFQMAIHYLHKMFSWIAHPESLWSSTLLPYKYFSCVFSPYLSTSGHSRKKTVSLKCGPSYVWTPGLDFPLYSFQLTYYPLRSNRWGLSHIWSRAAEGEDVIWVQRWECIWKQMDLWNVSAAGCWITDMDFLAFQYFQSHTPYFHILDFLCREASS